MSGIFDGIDPRRVPIIGDDIYQVGQVYSIINQSCLPEPVIAVKAMFHYAPTLIWALYKPEALDMTFERVGRRHKRKRYRKVKISALNQLNFNPNDRVTTAMFRLASLTERVGWYLIVADATTDWLLNWTSLAYQWSGCAVTNPDYAGWKGSMPFPVEPIVAQPYQVQGQEHYDAGQGFASNTIIGLVATGPYSITYQGTPVIIGYNGQFGEVTKVEIGVRVGSLPWSYEDAEVQDLDDGTTVWSYAKQTWAHQNLTIQALVRVSWSGGSMAMLNQVFQISGSHPSNLEPDP